MYSVSIIISIDPSIFTRIQTGHAGTTLGKASHKTPHIRMLFRPRRRNDGIPPNSIECFRRRRACSSSSTMMIVHNRPSRRERGLLCRRVPRRKLALNDVCDTGSALQQGQGAERSL